jgi:probable F420-dependent oxidoreductase
MKVYAGMDPAMPLADVGTYAQRVEALGFDGLHVPETVHDVFTMALPALMATSRIVVRTSVALAFVRSPLLTAYAAWDLQRLSHGRFQLGLGTQIRPNIVERYGMPWTEPAARLRDYVGAVQAAFDSFQSGHAPKYESKTYRLTRLQPYFNPGAMDGPAPPLWLGGVNRRVCMLAGEVAAGFVTHPTNSAPRYLEHVCLPALAEGATRAGRSVHDIELVVGTPVITGADATSVARERERQRGLLAFLYSTPAYARTLELYGWAEVGERLRGLTREGKWDRMPPLVTDEMLDELVPEATYDELPAALARRYGDVASGVVLHPPADPAHEPLVRAAIDALHRSS